MAAQPLPTLPYQPTQEGKIPGPVAGTRLTEEYVRHIARFAYLFAWPMVNVFNRFLTYDKLPEPGLAGGVLPVAPPNHLNLHLAVRLLPCAIWTGGVGVIAI